MMDIPVNCQSIAAAAEVIRAYVRQTPVLDLPTGAFGLSQPLSLKLELFQHAGSFKTRGAFNTLLSRPVPAAGVAAASGGNHGAAVAYAAQQLGIAARIFVPEISSPAKIAKIREFGADVVVRGARYADALELCEAYQQATGASGIHAYDAWPTIEGQGTCALEWEQQTRGLDTVLVAVGGGGLISGTALALDGRVRVIGVEPQGSAALYHALAAGHPVDVEVSSLAADSLGARNTGARVHAVAARAVERVVLVPDDAIRLAMKRLWSDMRIASEPGGACALAALLCGAYVPAKGERVGVLLCGGNVELSKLAQIVD
jgi:threonine dehydratase